MKSLSLFLLAIVITSCDDYKKGYAQHVEDVKSICFNNGGSEFHAGESGGSHHHVCVYKKEQQ